MYNCCIVTTKGMYNVIASYNGAVLNNDFSRFMEECESKIKDVFVSFFKECGPETIDNLYKNHG